MCIVFSKFSCDNIVHYHSRVEFSVGDKEIKNLRMVERHYFRSNLLKSFDFDFGFCMPNSSNSCEQIYEMPSLSADESESTLTIHV